MGIKDIGSVDVIARAMALQASGRPEPISDDVVISLPGLTMPSNSLATLGRLSNQRAVVTKGGETLSGSAIWAALNQTQTASVEAQILAGEPTLGSARTLIPATVMTMTQGSVVPGAQLVLTDTDGVVRTYSLMEGAEGLLMNFDRSNEPSEVPEQFVRHFVLLDSVAVQQGSSVDITLTGRYALPSQGHSVENISYHTTVTGPIDVTTEKNVPLGPNCGTWALVMPLSSRGGGSGVSIPDHCFITGSTSALLVDTTYEKNGVRYTCQVIAHLSNGALEARVMSRQAQG